MERKFGEKDNCAEASPDFVFFCIHPKVFSPKKNLNLGGALIFRGVEKREFSELFQGGVFVTVFEKVFRNLQPFRETRRTFSQQELFLILFFIFFLFFGERKVFEFFFFSFAKKKK